MPARLSADMMAPIPEPRFSRTRTSLFRHDRIFKERHQDLVAPRRNTFLSESIDSDRTVEATRIDNHEPIGEHLDLDGCPVRRWAKIPMCKRVDESLTNGFLWIFPEILAEQAPHDGAPLHVALECIQIVGPLREIGPSNRRLSEKPFATASWLLSFVVGIRQHDVGGQAWDELLWVRTERASRKVKVPAYPRGERAL